MKKKNLFRVMSVLSPIFVSVVFSVQANAGIIKMDDPLAQELLNSQPVTSLATDSQAEEANKPKMQTYVVTPGGSKTIHDKVKDRMIAEQKQAEKEADLRTQTELSKFKAEFTPEKPDLSQALPKVDVSASLNIPTQDVLTESRTLANLIENQEQPVHEVAEAKSLADLTQNGSSPTEEPENIDGESEENQVVVVTPAKRPADIIENIISHTPSSTGTDAGSDDDADTSDIETQDNESEVVITEDMVESISRQIADINMPVAESGDLLDSANELLSLETITAEQFDNIKNELETLKIQVSDANSIISDLQTEKSSTDEKLTSSKAEIAGIQQKLLEKESELEQAKTELADAERRSIETDGDNAIINAELSEHKVTVETLTKEKNQLQQSIKDSDKLFTELSLEMSKETELANTQKDEALAKKAVVEKNLEAIEATLLELKDKIKEKDAVIATRDITIEENTQKIDELTEKLEAQSEKYDAVIAEKEETNKAYCEIKDYAIKLEEEKAVLEQSPANVAVTQMMEMMKTMMMPLMMNMMAQQGPQIRMHNGIDNNYAQEFLQNNGTARAGLQVQSMSDMFYNSMRNPGGSNIYVGGDYYAGNYAVDGFNQMTTTQSRFPTAQNFRNNENNESNSWSRSFEQEQRPFAFNFNRGAVNTQDRFGQMNAQNSLGHQQRMEEMMRGNNNPNQQSSPQPSSAPRFQPNFNNPLQQA